MYRHPCPKGSNCPLLAGKQPSEKKRYHLMDYTHPCHVGCKYSVDKEWAWQVRCEHELSCISPSCSSLVPRHLAILMTDTIL